MGLNFMEGGGIGAAMFLSGLRQEPRRDSFVILRPGSGKRKLLSHFRLGRTF